jgi:hypothetical protein
MAPVPQETRESLSGVIVVFDEENGTHGTTLKRLSSNGSSFAPGLVGYSPEWPIGILPMHEFQASRAERLAKRRQPEKKI